GLSFDSSKVTATTGFSTLGSMTTRTQPGAPAAIAFGPDDFLPALESTILLDDRATLAIRWNAIGFAADSLDLHVTWGQVTWDVLLPPDVDHAQLPALDADLAAFIPPPSATDTITDDLRAIVNRPDETLVSHASGFR